jgi:hypothetical protein
MGRKACRLQHCRHAPSGTASILAVATRIPSTMRRPSFCPHVALQQVEQSAHTPTGYGLLVSRDTVSTW